MFSYFKAPLFAFVFLLLFAISGFAVELMEIPWLKIGLGILLVLFYLFVVFIIFFTEGAQALKIRHANDNGRMEMVRTGEEREINEIAEYKPFKGFLMGVILCLPMIILLTVHTIILLTGGTLLFFGQAAGFIYTVFYCVPTSFITVSTEWQYLFVLYALPLMIAVSGISYILGAKKQQGIYDKTEETRKEIYGDKN